MSEKLDYEVSIKLNKKEISTLLTLIYNEIWDEHRGEDKLLFVKELTKKLEISVNHAEKNPRNE